MNNNLIKLLANPSAFYYRSGLATPSRGYISPEARAKAKAKRKKKKK